MAPKGGHIMLHIRRETIKEMIAHDGSVNVQNLVKRFDVSVETIRRDLEALEKEGFLKRVYGGAVLTRPTVTEPAYFWRKEHNQREKVSIGEIAAGLIEDGDTVFLSYGTTTLEVARHMKYKKNVTVITNSVFIVMELANCRDITTYCLGGRVREGDMSTSGALAEQNMRFFNVNKVIAGVGGITPELGLMDTQMDESGLLQAYISSVGCIIAVCDHSKLGNVATYNICPANKLTHLVTDSGSPRGDLDAYRAMGISVHVAQLD